MEKTDWQALHTFHNALESLVEEHLLGVVSPEQVNEYYGYVNDCQISQVLRECMDLE